MVLIWPSILPTIATGKHYCASKDDSIYNVINSWNKR